MSDTPTKRTRVKKPHTGRVASQHISRIAYVEELLSTFRPRTEILREIKKKFGIQTRQAEYYMAAVHKRWEEEEKHERPTKRAKRLAQLESIILKAMQAEAWTAVATLLDKLYKIEGLFAPEQHAITHSGVSVQATEPDRVRERIAELASRHSITVPTYLLPTPRGGTKPSPLPPTPTPPVP